MDIHWQGHTVTISQLAHSQDTIPHSPQSPLVVGIHTHNPTSHNPPYATWHVPWWLRPSQDMFNHSSIHNAHMPLVFQPYTAILDATYFPLLLDTCDLLRERIQTSHKDGQSGHRPGTTSKEKYALHS